jgi:hypothetical protein
MHCYLYVRCKTVDCNSTTYIVHKEWPTDDYAFIDYPDEWFPLKVPCPKCHQNHSYECKEIGTQTSLTPLHPPGYHSFLPDPPPKADQAN